MRKIFAYILKLKFAPSLSSFLFDYETWARLYVLKKYLKNVDPEKNKKIIDVGAGTGRLELALKRTDIHLYDHNAESIEYARKYFPNTTVGTGTKINFDDNSFDYAISIHTLEHIPEDERENFLMELIRISKYGVYLHFPEGNYTELLCKNYLNALEKNGKEPNHWTVEHLEMGLPKKETVEKMLSKQKKIIFSYKYIRNYKIENFYLTTLRTGKYRLLNFLLSPPFAILSFVLMNSKPTIELVVIGNTK